MVRDPPFSLQYTEAGLAIPTDCWAHAVSNRPGISKASSFLIVVSIKAIVIIGEGVFDNEI